MKSITMCLSKEEADLVEKHRAAEAEKDLARQLHIISMEMIGAWGMWNKERKTVPTLSVFVDRYIPQHLMQYRAGMHWIFEEAIRVSSNRCREIVEEERARSES